MSIRELLQAYWGYSTFRPLQEEIIQHLLSGKDTLAMLPTGGGKSICFQVPGMFLEGMTIVVSPLIALMKDQVENLQKRNITATYINSSLSNSEVDRRLQGAMDGKYKFLYIAPERIASQVFEQRLPKMNVSLLVVDEAHCISQWGYDFRPSYLEIHRIRQAKPKVPIIALTASAIPAVKEDIAQKLRFQKHKVFEQSFKRDNLRYFVVEEENVMLRIVEIAKRTMGTGIVYVRTRKATESVAQHLQENGISALAYHGGLTHSDRDNIQKEWMENRSRVMVATNAFGMGIDKPDVRFVLHYHLPADLESYYQEAGRGGRDGKTAIAIAFRNPADIHELERWVKEKYPTWEQVQECFEALCEQYQIPNMGDIYEKHIFDIQSFAQAHKLSVRTLYNVVSLLDKELFLQFQEEKEDYGYLHSLATPQDWVVFQQQNPKFSLISDMILRNMGGAIFHQEVPFLPFVWKNALNWEEKELDRQLQHLVRADMISYTPPTQLPTITFLKNRQALTQNALNWQKYVFLQAQALWRYGKLLSYIENTKSCRSEMLQQYFGETNTTACGKCDVCIQHKKSKTSFKEITDMHEFLLDFILKNPEIAYRDALHQANIGTLQQREEMLRMMIDKGTIVADIRGKLKIA